MAKTKELIFTLVTLLIMAGTVTITGCGIFQSAIQTDEQVKITKCDSVKISVKVPIAIPDIPILDRIETRWNPAEQCFYAHWCYTVTADKSMVDRVLIIIEKVTAIVEKIIKLFYQTKT